MRFITAPETSILPPGDNRREQLLAKAIEHYQAAAARYPNFAVLQADLAWAYHLAVAVRLGASCSD